MILIEKQAAAKQTFVFLGSLTHKKPAPQAEKLRRSGFVSFSSGNNEYNDPHRKTSEQEVFYDE